MTCSCCNGRLNIGMIHKVDPMTGQRFKSCPHCSDANGSEHVFHPYPAAFGKTPARVTARNPDGYQSYCRECRNLDKGDVSKVHRNGRLCSSLI
ncbi:hypothetical protein FCL40_14770 [Ferrimonas sediminicola]|uniref:Uncharacterized protein n=1 Tax=Ferrimonas sediminicola TaxID=2569538 RepID=A0A4U1BAE2_9GAMM|nr:hypothetical protein FCL40_14770 [Ferrimonas sediminicola]